ncbi:zinc ribbon domain-containing protein [Streptomyces sp. NPDC057580]|uniref:zinc ribbon domain-containing protein n=1 Tax=Streptomyces sp. NPDC057580 TaxID=3346173 RepID=UPI0036B70BD0
MGAADQLKTPAQYRRGESDLVQRGGKWFLIATCDLPEPEEFEPVDWIGKEHRHATHLNHRISKEIVSVAQRNGRGLAVEELDAIRDRVRLRRDQRGTLSSWPFHRLGQHLAYKARRAGVPFLEVDATYTSQRCPRCGHTERANRPTRDRFSCRRCGLAGPVDVVAGVNVRHRARSAWVFVTAPVPIPV